MLKRDIKKCLLALSVISPHLILVHAFGSQVCCTPPLKISGKGTHRKKRCGLGFFFSFLLFSGKGKIEALLGATRQVMFRGQQIPLSLPSGTKESITGLGWWLIRRGSAWHACQELDTKPFSVHLSPSHSKWEDVCSGIRGNASSVTPPS